jgi:hypothetical protein
MRAIVLLPLTALVAVAAGCGSDIKEQTARSVLQRDLTLVNPTSEVNFASPVETGQLRNPRGTTHPSHRLARATRSRGLKSRVKLVDAWAPKPAAPVPSPAATPATPANDHELLPGKTVTVIPASSGPSTDTDRADDFPASQGRTMGTRGGGGTCHGGGRGPGVAAAPRPKFR